MLIRSLVELYVGLHSCLRFSPFKKLFWKAGSTPSRHLLNTLLSVELFKPFSYRNPDNSSIPGGSIENAFASSIAPRHLVDRSSFCSWIWFFVARYLLDTSVVEGQFLDTYLDSFLDTSRYLICRALHYWRFYLNVLHDLSFISLTSLDLSVPVHLPNTLSFTPNLFLKVSSSFFKFFYTW